MTSDTTKITGCRTVTTAPDVEIWFDGVTRAPVATPERARLRVDICREVEAFKRELRGRIAAIPACDARYVLESYCAAIQDVWGAV